MGKLDSMIKCAQARNLLEEKQYQKAIEIIEQIDIEKVKSIMDLRTIGQVYIESKRFLDAREVYLLICDKVQSRNVFYHLIYISIQCGLLEEAEHFYGEYKKLDGVSVDCHILNFYIQKAKGANHQDLILYIKEILSYEYLEEWAYELAKLYHKEGMEEDCIEECKKIILWFGEGIIVEKAMLLKLHYVDGLDISSPKAIDETRNIAAELRMAARLADRQDRERYEKEQEDMDDFFEEIENVERVEEQGEKEEQIKEEQVKEEKAEKEQGIEDQVEDNCEVDKTIEAECIQQMNETRQDEETVLQTGEKSKKQQMIESIVEEAIRTREMPHFSVISNNEDKIMEVTKKLMRELCEKGVLKTPRIARITAAKVNSINLEDKKEQLEGSCLLIEEAHELSLDSLQTLCQIMKRMRINVVIGFVDEEDAMTELLNRNRKLKSLIKYELYV